MTIVKTHKQRTYLDPIHGPIELDFSDDIENLLTKIVDTKEFQRLRRIRQMGLGSFTFHGAEHTRFGHSLGTLFIARKMISQLANNFPDINNYKTKILISALIHDIGHGPFSHTSEKFTKFTHEDWTKKIIESESEINALLKSHDNKLPELIVEILSFKTKPIFISQLISSYIDCDRLDYLHRDSYYVGVPYGLTGSERIIASLEIHKGSDETTSPLLVVKENTGLDAVVHYLQARHSMYQQIYQHKKNLACDFLLRKIIERAKNTNPKNTSTTLMNWMNSKISTDSYIEVDDFLLMLNIENWAYDPLSEKILKDLSSRFLTRKLFKSLEFRQGINQEAINEILEKTQKFTSTKSLDSNYYAGLEQSGSKPYEPYQASDKNTPKAIYIKQKNGAIKELSEVSKLIKALSQENIVKTCLVFTPEIEEDINNIKGFEEIFK